MSPGAIGAAAGPPAAPGGGVPAEPGPRSKAWTGRGEPRRGCSARAHLAAVGEELTRLVGLQWELGKAEGRQIVRAVAVAAARGGGPGPGGRRAGGAGGGGGRVRPGGALVASRRDGRHGARARADRDGMGGVPVQEAAMAGRESSIGRGDAAVARSPAEIQAQIRLTRRAIDARLDAVNEQISYRRWAPYAFLAGAALVGLGLSRLPILRLFRLVGGVAATVLTVVHAYDTVRARLSHPRPMVGATPAPGSRRRPRTGFDAAAAESTCRATESARAACPRFPRTRASRTLRRLRTAVSCCSGSFASGSAGARS